MLSYFSLGRLGRAVVLFAFTFALFLPATNVHSRDRFSGGDKISIDTALALALIDGPDVTIAKRKADVQRGALAGAEVFPLNPQIAVGAGGRYGFGEGLGADASVGISQAIPLFGRWGAAEAAAKASVIAMETDVWAERVRVARIVALGFIDAQRAKALREVAEKRVALVRDIVEIAQRRLDAGDGTILDVNVWEAELGQAEASRAKIDAVYVAARVALATSCGLPPNASPEPSSTLDDTMFASWRFDRVERADLEVLRRRIESAVRTVVREERTAWPDVTLSASTSTEGARYQSGPAGEVIGGFGMSVPLALFERNQGGIRSAQAQEDVRRAELTRAELRANAEVVVARAQLTAFERAAKALKVRVKSKQQENLRLLQQAYVAGKLGASDLLLRQRFVLDAEAAYVAAVADVLRGRVRMAFASGALSAHVNRVLAASKGGSQ